MTDRFSLTAARGSDMHDRDGQALGKTFVLPGIGEITHLHDYETEYLHEEIFVRQAYTRHGVALHPGDTVLDVGANIGMFTLFAHQQCPNVQVFAFEPGPAAFAALAENALRHCPGSRVFNYGISDQDGVAPFTFYVNSTVFSSFVADPRRDSNTIRTIVENVLHSRVPIGSIDLRPIVDRLLRDRLVASVHQCATRTLSTVVREIGIDRIDLLKIDTEGSEVQVLQGLEDKHWDRIGQVVVEVHDRAEDRAMVVSLLEDRGFRVTVDEQEHLLRGTPLASIFALREPLAEPDLGAADL
jgi:FkbM family methyltransferase